MWAVNQTVAISTMELWDECCEERGFVPDRIERDTKTLPDAAVLDKQPCRTY